MKILSSVFVAILILFPTVSNAEGERYNLPQPALTTMNIPIAWGITRGDGAKVAVLDTGVVPHTEYNQSFAFGDTYPSFSTEVSNAHGTYIAGVISSQHRLQGVAPQAGLYSFKVVHNIYTDDSLSWGIESAIDANVDVITMSLNSAGLSTDRYTKTVASIQKAISKNIIVINSAGNNTCDCPRWLAVIPGVVSVGSVDIYGDLSSFSNYGDWVDINAVGSSVLTTTVDERYMAQSGTSLSAPFVAGIAALMKSVDKTLTPQRFKQIIVSTSYPNKIANAGKAVYTLKGGFHTYFVPRVDYNVGLASTSTFSR